MITLNPSSTCDICLDAYTCRNPLKTPHALPCGHILCGRCISRLRHSTCPFCRNPFQGGTVVRLHVAPPGPSSSPSTPPPPVVDYEKEKELDLLRRLALCLNSPPAPALRQLKGEVTQWLSSRRSNISEEPVYKLWTALERQHTPSRPRLLVKQPNSGRAADDLGVGLRLSRTRSREDYEKRQAIETLYGGRGLFASVPIPKDNLVRTSCPYAYVIFHAYRKEVCAFCFAYSMDAVPRKNTWSIRDNSVWFCSQQCLHDWTEEWGVLGTQMIHDVGAAFERLSKRRATLTELEIDTSKFVLSALIRQTLSPSSFSSFLDLQNNEIPYLNFQPWLVESHQSIYTFIREIIHATPSRTREALGPLVQTPETAREILGRDPANVFGVYDKSSDQMLGFVLYISASYFNHSCTPNVKKHQSGRDLQFYTTRDISENEELVISYIDTRDPVAKRKEELKKGWFFECECCRCVDESADSPGGVKVQPVNAQSLK